MISQLNNEQLTRLGNLDEKQKTGELNDSEKDELIDLLRQRIVYISLLLYGAE